MSNEGDDSAAGTPGAPVKTLAKAVELAGAGGKVVPVYACAEVFVAKAVLPAGTKLYGGLDCKAGWTYGGGKKTTIAPASDEAAQSQIALVLSAGNGTTHIEDVVVKAPDAVMAGGSSIAALADSVTAELVRCELAAGNGKAGAVGETPSEPVGPEDPNDPAIRGTDGAKACTDNAPTGNLGGKGTTNAKCPTVIGGNGGAGREANGEDGTDGQPVGAYGLHGTGQPMMGAWNCIVGAGQLGDNGADGVPGAGALMTEHGTVSSSGFVGAAGKPGQDGGPGQGGGGGGGAKGALGCNGASGGGGGAGGCGGKGGRGGQGGGASIALASVGATVMLSETSLSSGNGGDGGEGGKGQGGAIGGAGGFGGLGSGTLPACAGGQGGVGGFGGKGGGGRGGASVGIAFTGVAPVREGGDIATGQPGKGGAGVDAAGAGFDGAKEKQLDLSKGI